MNSSGISTAISDTVRLMMVKPICREPRYAASRRAVPCSTCREMFSIITIASSTTKPVAMVSAISVRLLREKPTRYMTPKVPTSDSGTAMLGMRVAEALRRKKKMTSTTRITASSNSNCTSAIEARMLMVRSVSTETLIEAGRLACSCGSIAVMRSTVWMTLAPGWRWMLTMIAGAGCGCCRSAAHAASFTFSAVSTTAAMSDTRSGAPFLYTSTMLR